MHSPRRRILHQKEELANVMGVELQDIYNLHVLTAQKLKEKQKLLIQFKPKILSLTLADRIQSNVAALTTVVDLKVESKVLPSELIVLPEAKGNRTLLGTDFLQAAGDVLNGKWYFCENPQIQYPFYKVPSNNENSKSFSDSEERSAETSSSVKVPETSSSVNPRSDEGKHLTKEQRTQLNCLLQEFKSCFEPGGEPTPFSENRINTGNSPPVAEPPYRMNPAKGELLKK
ncbi:hypothetical protein AVEN_126347-1 [Araneus ventricosus]|uniref:Uncharacterized protein n=1 Tax=Araneus ventricosus TaxID=182803 RepID=A0A4Y2R8F5_ARAVE|nr:hypothetical protein AVEN_126347-1 [Araneus ventricosus]